jgi:RIO1 family
MPLTRGWLERSPRRRLHGGRNLTKAVIELVEVEGRTIILKDFVARPWPVRRLLGPWHLDREVRAYRRLEGLDGIPRFLARVDRCAIALEYVSGPTLAALRRGDLPEPFYLRLEALVDAMHARGVAHGDLHGHDVIAAPGPRPFVIDFSTAVCRSRGPLGRWLFQQMCRADRRSVAKLRSRLAPRGGSIPPRPPLYHAGNLLQRWLRPRRHDRPDRR